MNPGSLDPEQGFCSLEISVLEVGSQTNKKISKDITHVLMVCVMVKSSNRFWDQVAEDNWQVEAQKTE